MYYKILVHPLPKMREIYTVTRNTTWRCADKSNIIVFIEDGCCFFEINSNKQLIKKGQAIVIPANTPYIRTPFQNTMCTMLYLHFLTEEPIDVSFSNEMNESTLNANSSSSVFLRQVIDFSEKYDSFFKRLNDMISGDVDVGNTYSELNFSVSVAKVLINLGVLVLPKMSTNIQNISYYPPSLRKTLLYIQKNYRQKISTEELSKVANISQQHLIRMFNKHLNSTPIEYINSVKIAHAMDMLRSPRMSIKEISYELGFDNPNYFSRLFKKMQGFTPQESRKYMMNYDLENK